MRTQTQVIHTEDRLRENRILMLRQEGLSPSEFVGNVVSSFKESAFKMKDYLLYLQGFKGDDKTLSSIRSTVRKADDELEGFNFVGNAKLMMQTPTGFKSNMSDYCAALNSNIELILASVLTEVSHFSAELSVYISDKSIKVSVRDNSMNVKRLKAQRIKFMTDLEPYFHDGSNQRRMLGDIFGNTGDALSAGNSALLAYEKAYKADPIGIRGDVETICNKIETIINMAGGDAEIETSQESIRNLAEKAYELGRQLEMLSIYCNQAEVAVVCMDHNLELMLKNNKHR